MHYLLYFQDSMVTGVLMTAAKMPCTIWKILLQSCSFNL